MKCYNHHDRDAFGICKSCGKALCLECMDKNSENIVCGGNSKCLNRDKQNENLYNNVDKIYSRTNVKRSLIIAITFMIVSIPFIVSTIITLDLFSLIFAIFFLATGIVLFKRAKDIQVQDE